MGREIKDGEWNLSEILKLLRYEVENRERCEGVNALGLKEKTYSPEDQRNNWKLEPSSAAGYLWKISLQMQRIVRFVNNNTQQRVVTS